MASWTPAQLDEIDTRDELSIATRRPDGTLRRPVTIWMVRVGDDLFVRAARGAATGWNRRAHEAGAGRVTIGSVIELEAAFEPGDRALDQAISDAYDAKYDGRYPRQYIDPVISAASLPTTLRVIPA